MTDLKFTVTGMSCAACSARVEKAVSKVEGVSSVAVSLLTNSMRVTGDALPDAIVKAVEDAGYGASMQDSSSHKSDVNTPSEQGKTQKADAFDTEVKTLKTRLSTSLIFLCVLMYFSMGHMMWNWPIPEFFTDNHVAMGLLEMLLTVIIMIINKKFFVNGARGFMHKAPNMDSLVSLGAGAAFVYSTVMLFAMTDAQVHGGVFAAMQYMDEFYFESAGMILTLITFGKLLEARSKGRTTDAIKSLIKLAPAVAIVDRYGKELEIPTDEVAVGDVVIIKPGSKIPVDGNVIEGTTSVDESSLTGESIPVDKACGDTVKSGTLNTTGFIKIKATHVGADTTLSQIIELMNNAASTKAPIAKVADKVSGVFVPIVIAIAVITIVVWLLLGQTVGFALARGISVLVISCPCALGLATPVAIMVGSGKGAKNGILFKTAESLEQTGKADIIALDKTGTITEGKPVVTDVVPMTSVSEDELLSYAYSLEKRSEHPLAKAIVEYAKECDIEILEVSDFQSITGKGLSGKIDTLSIFAGNLDYMKQVAEIMDTDLIDKARKCAQAGKTPLFFAYQQKTCQTISVAGFIAVADTIKTDSKKAVSSLKRLGLQVVMLTGDRTETAYAIGKEAGVDKVYSELLPIDKESIVRELSENGNVIMVGDGINDAPALASASVGVAIGAGTQVAIDAADIVLMNSSLQDVVKAIRLSGATLTNIHENLFWAFIYNIIGIPLAAGCYIALFGWTLNPMFGALAMSLSSFCVVSNALRLNTFQTNSEKRDGPRFSLFSKKDENLARPQLGIKQDNIVKKPEKEKNMEKIVKISGMMCGHCEKHAHDALIALPGVESAEVSHEKGEAVLICSSEVSDDAIKKAIADEGYEVTNIE